MKKFTNWLGHNYVEPEKASETKPWSSVLNNKVPTLSPGWVEPHELHHAASVPTGIEKNSDSIWAEFESVVPVKLPLQPESEAQSDEWADTLTPSEYADTVRGEFDDS